MKFIFITSLLLKNKIIKIYRGIQYVDENKLTAKNKV